MNIIETLEKEQMAALETKRLIPDFAAGDTVRVNVKVVEGNRERVQAYEGVCIARSGGGINESFTVRKISYGEGVERVFPLYSPWIDSIDVVRRGRVRRAKLYYLRGLRGKAARIAERKDVRGKGGKFEFKGFKRPKGEVENLKLIKGWTRASRSASTSSASSRSSRSPTSPTKRSCRSRKRSSSRTASSATTGPARPRSSSPN